jgi:Zn-dependent protease
MNRLMKAWNKYTPRGILEVMKLTPLNKKILTFMASTPGRWARIIAGVSLAGVALMQGGASLFLLIPAAMMLTTGIMNYCPMGPLYGETIKSGELLKKLQTYDMK